MSFNDDRKLRRIECYPPRKYSKLLEGYAKLNEIERKGEAVKVILKHFFDNLPKDQLDRIISKNGY